MHSKWAAYRPMQVLHVINILRTLMEKESPLINYNNNFTPRFIQYLLTT